MKAVEYKLSNIAEISAGQPAPQESNAFSEKGYPFVRAGSLEKLIAGANENSLEIVNETFAKSNGFKLYPKETIIFAKSGMSATLGRIYKLRNPAYIVSHLCAVKPNLSIVHSSYLMRWLEKYPPSNLIPNSAYPSIRTSNIASLKILLPELTEQKRIAAILDKANELKEKRKKAIQKLDELVQAVFIDMFGDPVRNPKGWDTISLGDAVEFISGGTPSKSNADFWNGAFPWVSPKDMKSAYILDAIDHVSESVFNQTNLKRIEPCAVLMVVRGMILSHSAPVAINMQAVCINQDMKALVPRGNLVTSQFLLGFMQAAKRLILSMVSTAAHGTKRIETEDIKGIRLILPPTEQQKFFESAVSKVLELTAKARKSLSSKEVLALSLTESFLR